MKSTGPRVLLINQYFLPDVAATGQLLADLGEDLAVRGLDVNVVTGVGRYVSGSRAHLPRTEVWRGVTVRRVWCTSFGRGSTLGRVSDYATFLVSAFVRTALGPRFDVVVCLSTPPFVAVLGLVAALRGSRFIYKVEDLYPDVAVALGAITKGGIVDRFLSRVSSHLLRRADAVVALDRAMADALKRRGARRVEVIPNWADGDAIAPDPQARRRFRVEHGLEDRFIVLYSGNLGLAHRFDAVCGAARVLERTDPPVIFLFVGDGPRMAEVRKATTGLECVRFLPYQPREKLNGLYNAADIHLVTVRDEAAGLLVPSKYAAALAAGKPVLLVGGGGADLYTEIATEQVGWVSTHDTEQVVAVIRSAREDADRSHWTGERARRLFEREYTRRICTSRYSSLVNDVVGGSPEVVDRSR